MPDEQPQYVDEHHERIHTFASDYLEEDERDEFVDSMMERRGYQRAHHWLPPDEDESGPGQPAGGKKPLVKRRAAPAQPAPRQGSYFRH